MGAYGLVRVEHLDTCAGCEGAQGGQASLHAFFTEFHTPLKSSTAMTNFPPRSSFSVILPAMAGAPQDRRSRLSTTERGAAFSKERLPDGCADHFVHGCGSDSKAQCASFALGVR